MKEATISLAVQKLGDLLIQKVNFLKGVKGQVAWLKDELQRMQSFLKDASEREPNDERIRMWISEVRQLAEYAETVIDKFNLKIDSPRGNKGLFQMCAFFPKQVYCLHRTGQAIKSIRRKLKDIDDSRERFGIHSLDDAGAVSSKVTSDYEPPRQVVGVEELCNHVGTSERFVSVDFSLKELMQEVVLQLLEPGEDRGKILEIFEKLPEQRMKRMVYDQLQGRRYLIMVDDMAPQQDWEYLASDFPLEQEFNEVASPDLASSSRKRPAVDTSPSPPIKKKKSTLTSIEKEVATFDSRLPPTISDDKLQNYFKNLSSASSNSEIPSAFPVDALLNVIKAELNKSFLIDANSVNSIQNSLASLLACQISPATHEIFQQMLTSIDSIDIHIRLFMENLKSSRAHLSRLSQLQNQQTSLLQEFNSVVKKEQVASVEHCRLMKHKTEVQAKLAHLRRELSETQTQLMTLRNDQIKHQEIKYSLYSQATSLDTELEPLLQRKNTFERHVSISEKVMADLATKWIHVRELSAEAEASLLDTTYKDNAEPTVPDSIILPEQSMIHPDPPA